MSGGIYILANTESLNRQIIGNALNIIDDKR